MKNMYSNLFVGRDCVSGEITITAPNCSIIFDYFKQHNFLIESLTTEKLQKVKVWYGEDWEHCARVNHYIFNEIFNGKFEIQIAQYYNS